MITNSPQIVHFNKKWPGVCHMIRTVVNAAEIGNGASKFGKVGYCHHIPFMAKTGGCHRTVRAEIFPETGNPSKEFSRSLASSLGLEWKASNANG